MEVSRFCFEDVVVEDAGELAALELLRLNLFDFDTRLDAIVLSFQPPHKLRQDQATIATPAVTPRSRGERASRTETETFQGAERG